MGCQGGRDGRTYVGKRTGFIGYVDMYMTLAGIIAFGGLWKICLELSKHYGV